MEKDPREEAQVLNACLSAVIQEACDVTRYSDLTGYNEKTVREALAIMENDGVIYSYGKKKRLYALCDGLPWCEQCDCYHPTMAACIDEVS